MSDTVKWKSKDGTELGFDPLPQTSDWSDAGGLYLFGCIKSSTWGIFYVGQTNNFGNRIPNHDRWNEAKKLGATHVLAVVLESQAKRDKYEKELIQELQPSLNTQLK